MDSDDPPRIPAPTTASMFARRDGDTGNSTRNPWDWAFDFDDFYHAAEQTYYKHGGDMKKAHEFFRRALSCGVNRQYVFHAWIYMEHVRARGDIAGIRACFEEWRSCGGGDGAAGDPYFWCHYATFELLSGTAARARAVAKAAVAASPRDPMVFAMYAKMELRLGRDRRARRIVRRAREIFTADEDAVKWVENDVELYRRFMRLRQAAARPTIGHLFRSFFTFCGCRGGSA